MIIDYLNLSICRRSFTRSHFSSLIVFMFVYNHDRRRKLERFHISFATLEDEIFRDGNRGGMETSKKGYAKNEIFAMIRLLNETRTITQKMLRFNEFFIC